MKKYIVIALIIAASFTVMAQTNVWKVNWDMNAPARQSSDFINKFSVRGVSIDASWFLNDNFALGGTVGWGLFYEKTDKITEVLEGGNITFTGPQQKYLNFIPLLFNGEYYFGSSDHIRPYLGVGLGAAWVENVKNAVLYQIYDKNWMFALAPEVGVIIPLVNNLNFHVKAKCLQGLWSDGDNLQTFTISVGFAFTSYKF
ncbi:MAG: porin family protein [Bacteroidales bacterium]|jgi:outer membrane protein W|nr:porin family protein [Bacteroidales bacterium]